MTRTTLKPAKKENLYRCPACGSLVDNAQPEEVRLHHDHILHPDRYGKPASTQALPKVNPAELFV